MQAASELVEVPPVWTAHHEGDSMSNQGHEPCATGDLEVRSLSDHEWRVGDRRCHESSPAKVLGYIEKRGSAFEVMNIEAPRRHVMFDHFESAVASFASAFPA
jgi:hypothetical protein